MNICIVQFIYFDYFSDFMDEILELNKNYFWTCDEKNTNLISVEKIIKSLEKHSIVKIQWLSQTRKLSTAFKVSLLLWERDNVFYFNSQVYKNARIKNASGLKKLFSHYSEKKAVDTTKIIVLESVDEIDGIKDFISELFQQKKYKIILIWALKRLPWLHNVVIPEYSLFERIDIHDEIAFSNYSKLGWLYAYSYVDSSQDDFYIRNIIKDSILLQNIIIAYGLKDIFLFQSTLWFLARNLGKYLSIRDITKLTNEGNLKASVITISDYIQNSINTWLLYHVKRYDCKKETHMSSKWSYYFGDVWLLASFKKDVVWKKDVVLENILFLELNLRGYSIYSGINGKFHFTFFTKKLWEKMCIHLSHQTDKNEIKKEIKKLSKIKIDAEKYLIVENLAAFKLRKKDYEDVQLLNFSDIKDIL